MARVLVRFRGLCVFVADNNGLTMAREVNALLVDAVVALPGIDAHLAALTFHSKNYSSGAQSATAVQGPGDLQVGIWNLQGMILELSTPSSTPLEATGLGDLASLNKLDPRITDETIKPACLNDDPRPQPIASRLTLRNGTMSAAGFYNHAFRELQVLFETADEVTFGVRPFGGTAVTEALTLRPQGSEVIEVGIGALSVRSLDPSGKPDHDLAYLALLKNPPEHPVDPSAFDGGGGGCVPVLMKHP